VAVNILAAARERALLPRAKIDVKTTDAAQVCLFAGIFPARRRSRHIPCDRLPGWICAGRQALQGFVEGPSRWLVSGSSRHAMEVAIVFVLVSAAVVAYSFAEAAAAIPIAGSA
jgi:hypothetical protein